jgi:hypothetical protein
VATQLTTGGDIQCYTGTEIWAKCILSRIGFCKERQEEDKMERGKWKAGDLVQVESTQKTGWGDECHNHLVLVLGMYKRKRTQHYPLTADLEAGTREKDVVYEVLRDDGKYVKLGLKDYAYPNLRLTNRLVQRSCAED